MNNGFVFAILAGIAMGAWGFFHDKSLSFISPLIGATLVSLVATIIGIIFIIFDKESNLETFNNIINYKSLFFIVIVGILALAIDFFTLKTFSTGIDVSVGFPIIIIISVISGLLLGIIFGGEIINYNQILGILFSIIGIYMILGI